MGVLTESDRHSIDRARELAGLSGVDSVRAYTGQDDNAAALAGAFGAAQAVLLDLVYIIDRLSGEVFRAGTAGQT